MNPVDATVVAPDSAFPAFPVTGNLEEQMVFLLRFAVLAPSTYNTQPWLFRVTVDGVDVFADYTRRLPVADPGGRELLMSIGAAVMNLRVAAAHFGFCCDVTYNHSGASEEPLASVRITYRDIRSAGADVLGGLFGAITRRHTNRHPFLLSRIPTAVLDRVSGLAAGTDILAVTCTDGDRNSRIAEVVSQGDKRLMADAGYRRNLSSWLHANGSSHIDGMPAQAFGVDGRLAAIAPWAAGVLDLGKIRAAHDRNLCLEAPGLIALCSEDSVPHVVAVGELLEHMLLVLTAEGLHHSYFNLPIQVPELRTELQHILEAAAPPQLLLRIGYSLSEPVTTARRPLKDVLVRM